MKTGDYVFHRSFGWCVLASAVDQQDPTPVWIVAYVPRDNREGLTTGILTADAAVPQDKPAQLEAFRKMIMAGHRQ